MHTKINMQVMFTAFIIVSECKYLSCVSGSTNTTMNAVKTMKHRPLVTFTWKETEKNNPFGKISKTEKERERRAPLHLHLSRRTSICLRRQSEVGQTITAKL